MKPENKWKPVLQNHTLFTGPGTTSHAIEESRSIPVETCDELTQT